MHGVPRNLDLKFLMGNTLTGVLLGEFQLQFYFHPKGTLMVEGDWELLSSDGSVVDRSVPNAERTEYRVHQLLGREIIEWAVDPPRSFSLTFEGGSVLRIFDNSTQYESFSIHPGDIYV